MAKKIYIVQAGFLPVGASDVTGWRSHSFYAGRRAYDGAVAQLRTYSHINCIGEYDVDDAVAALTGKEAKKE